MSAIVSTVQNTTTTLCSSLVHGVHQINDFHFKCCLAKTTGTVIGTVGSVSLMMAPFSKGGVSILSFVAVGSLGTLMGIGINLATDFVIRRQRAGFLSEVGKLSNNDDKNELKRVKGLSFADPTLLLNLMGIGGPLDELRILSNAAKLLQVHALLVRMIMQNMKLLVKIAYYRTGDPFYRVLQWATSDKVNESLKWMAVGATGIVVLIDFALIINEWRSGNRAVECGHQILVEIQEGLGVGGDEKGN